MTVTTRDLVEAISNAAHLQAEVERLRAENDTLRKLLAESADEISEYVESDYPANERSMYPDQQRRYLRDMDIVLRIKAALRGE